MAELSPKKNKTRINEMTPQELKEWIEDEQESTQHMIDAFAGSVDMMSEEELNRAVLAIGTLERRLLLLQDALGVVTETAVGEPCLS
jgi:hypothetical protein